MINWQDLFTALALVLVIEGIMPFLSPAGLRRIYAQMINMDDKALRMAGLVSMVSGVVLLAFVK